MAVQQALRLGSKEMNVPDHPKLVGVAHIYSVLAKPKCCFHEAYSSVLYMLDSVAIVSL